ncbi:MAG TPA: TIGR01777 family oxidoreductase [Gemmatimonadales bacterium]|nr:TIGR01777 family oxidoreductase [Gemmatimonadales bacterium]
MSILVAITGASGFVGRAVVASLKTDGHRVLSLVRRPAPGDTATWDPATGAIDRDALEGLDAVIHLAGEDISRGRWTTEKKHRIRQSRVAGTSLLAGALGGLTHKPAVLVSTSAVGIYGDRGDEILTETSRTGDGFLADVGTAWEAATTPAAEAGIRVVRLRFGIVLDPAGGALERMLLPFRLGVGGPLGSGRQWVSWVTRAELVRIIRFVMDTPTLAGPVNAVSPSPVTFAELARTLGQVLRRPALLPVPPCALRLLFGEMADGMLLASQRCLPEALGAAGYQFQSPELEGALREQLAPGR